MENKRIEAGIAEAKLAFKLIIGAEIFVCLFFSVFFIDSGPKERDIVNNTNYSAYVKYVIAFLVIGFFVFINVLYWNNYVKKLKKLLYVRPIKCIVEDLIVTSYRQDNKKRYTLTFLAKSVEDGKLYYAYDRHMIPLYKSSYTKLNNGVMGLTAVRKDRTPVVLGDIMYIYINKLVDVSVKVDHMSDTVKLNGSKYTYIHANADYDASVFESVQFFDGALDVEGDLY